VKLYHSPGSCSQAVHIALLEARLPFELVQVDLAAGLTVAGADFLAINPLGTVPVLELADGALLTETAAILPYVADLAPARGLAPPPGTFERVRLHETLNFTAAEIHKNFMILLEARDRQHAGYVRVAAGRLQRRFAWLDVQLAMQPFLLGTDYSVADAYLFVLTNWARADWIVPTRGTNLELNDAENLRSWHGRVSRRRAVQDALHAQVQVPLIRRVAA
jgi:glutathione S-transferase